jgi:hypothetical protein
VRLTRERVEKVDGSTAGNLEVDVSHDGLPARRGEGRLCGGGGLRHEDPLGAGYPAVLVPPRDRIPGDPHGTPVPTLVRLRLGAGRTPALLMLMKSSHSRRAVVKPEGFGSEEHAQP